MPYISAVVATLNRTTEIERLFDSVLLNGDADIELIIVDQNLDFLIDGLINKYMPKLNIVHVKMVEANQSKARNYGASLAKGTVLCFPDDDCWFESDSLNQVMHYFTSGSAADMLIIHWKQNPVQGVLSGYLSPKFIYSFKAVGYATYVMFFKREKFEELGGFMQTIGIGKYIGGGEDSELLFRAAKQNFSIYYDSGIDVNHIYIPVYKRDLPVIRARQRAMGLMYYQYPVSAFIILKGMISPFIKMITAPGADRKKHYNAGVGRLQGFFHGYKKGKDIFKK